MMFVCHVFMQGIECELWSSYRENIVARGTAFLSDAKKVIVHGVEVKIACFRVQVNEVLNENLPVPIPCSEIKTLGEAKGSFIPWPKAETAFLQKPQVSCFAWLLCSIE